METKRLIATGATNGIGLDSVMFIASASSNNHVIIGARNVSKGEAVLKDLQSKNIQGTLSLVQLDTDKDDSISAAVKKIKDAFGRLDVLVNNAGICPETADTGSPSRAILRSTFETNVFGPSILTDAFVPLLKLSQTPKIINVSSLLGSISTLADAEKKPNFAPYQAYRMSKAALNMLTAYQYDQLKQFGFKIWAFCPGYVVTDLGRDRETRQKQGIESSETSAKALLEIVEGKRDAEVGQFVGRYGEKYSW